jgi:hypothetical protein
MDKKNQKKYYIPLYYSLILTLIFFILLFYYFPKFSRNLKIASNEKFPALHLVIIPQTAHKIQRSYSPPAKPIIPVESEDVDIMDYVKIFLESTNNLADSINTSDLYSINSLSFLPRQIFEVIPAVPSNCNGEILLRLKIGTNGKMVEFKVVKNNTKNRICLEKVVEAVKKSRWESAIVCGKAVEYWIEKSYIFNL